MQSSQLSNDKRETVRREVDRLLGRSQAFRAVPQGLQAEIADNTARVAEALAGGGSANLSDPYAAPLRPRGARRQSAARARGLSRDPRHRLVRASDQFRAEAALAGAEAAGALIREVDFTRFVSELVTGVFHSVVQSSMDQMKAYAELVKSVATSLNEFRDENVSVNQGRDHLVSRFPNLFQINVVDDQPRVIARDGAEFADLPDFGGEFGLDEDITDIDEETIEQKLVPAARDSLARSRQKLLATMVLMGINRIIVTDGKINAKVRFKFSARDSMQRKSTAVDFERLGRQVITTRASEEEESGSGDEAYDEEGNLLQTGAGNRYATDMEATIEQPMIQITDQTDTQSEAEIVSAGNLTGEVSLNFRSETVPLERMLETDQVMALNELGSGHAVPPPGGAPAEGSTPSAPLAPTAPAPTTP